MVVLFSENEIEVICTCIALSLGYYSLQEHQKDVVTNFVTGNAILPSGYGKSLCYTCLPGTFDKLLYLANSKIAKYFLHI